MYALAVSISGLLALLSAFHFGLLSLYCPHCPRHQQCCWLKALAWLRRNRRVDETALRSKICAKPSGTVENRGTSGQFLKKLAGTTRLELATSAVTGQRSNQLNYVPSFVGKLQAQAFICWADSA
jgi:hypothetical protein